MNVDHFVKIGKSHKICEDYIISGYDPIPYVILSDGCSSSRDTDMGARILTHISKEFIKTFYNRSTLFDHMELSKEVIHKSANIIKQMGIDKTCLDCTLIVTFILYEYAYVYIFGDGVVITIDLNDKISFDSISYKNNMPYYLGYKIDPYRNKLYEDSKPKKFLRSKKSNDEEAFTIEIKEYKLSVEKAFSTDRYKGLFIASDGIESFINEVGEPYDFLELLKDVTAFKNTNGEFLKRRMGSKKGLINTFEARGITHYDDISVGGFIF